MASPLPRPSSRSGSRDWEEVANAMLEDGMILSALELHTELLECGREVAQLRDYFSNPGNFEHALPHVASNVLLADMNRTPSMSTFDSLELGRYSDDSNRENEEKVAVLEFELRKAYETIKSLRSSLTEASEMGPAESEKASGLRATGDDPINPLEKRALNFLVHEYLIQQDNKLSAITFTEENADQDFDDWDDVHLDIPKPPNLLNLFRDYRTYVLSDQDRLERIKQLERQLLSQTSQLLTLKKENEALSIRIQRMRSDDAVLAVGKGGSGEKESSALLEAAHSRASLTETSDVDQETTPTTKRHTSVFETVEEASASSGEACAGKKQSAAGSPALRSASIASVTSDLTVSEECDDTETVVGEGERREPRSRSSTFQRDNTASPEQGQSHSHTYQTSVSFRRELLGMIRLDTESRVGVEIGRVSVPGADPVQLLARSLPHIYPHVHLSKREELIPLLLCVVAKHPEGRVRDKLLNILFNLIKRPDKKQRQVIMSACVAIAKLMGSSQVECELLPQIWEEITHKHYERRLLVAESCGVLSPYMPAELRSSLMLSMLRQMLCEDKAESVRQAVVRSLGVIVAFTHDEDKFKEFWELLLRALSDPSRLVVSSAYTALLPALAAWAAEQDSLHSNLLSYFLHQMLNCVKQVARSDGESGAVEQCLHQIATLTHLIPWHYVTFLYSNPDADPQSPDPTLQHEVSFPKAASPLLDVRVIVGDEGRLQACVEAFERAVAAEAFTPWKCLDWFSKEYLTKVVKVSVALGFSQLELVHSLALLLSTYCSYLGHTFTHKVIIPFFEKSLSLPKHNTAVALADGHTQITTPVLPIYIAGVLACFAKDEKMLVEYLRSITVELALSFAPLDSIKAAVLELKREKRFHQLILNMLQQLAGHPSFQVRSYTALLYGSVVSGVDDKLLKTCVVPQLKKLASDSDMNVRINTIPSFGTIMEAVTNKDVLVRVHEQFEQLVANEACYSDHRVLMALVSTLARIGPNSDPVFRDEFIIPRLAQVAIENDNAINETRRRDVASALLDAYKNISESFISLELLTSYMLPGLHGLLKDMQAVDRDRVPTVQQLIRNCQSKVDEYRFQKNTSASVESVDSKSSKFLSKLMPNFETSPSKLKWSLKKKSFPLSP